MEIAEARWFKGVTVKRLFVIVAMAGAAAPAIADNSCGPWIGRVFIAHVLYTPPLQYCVSGCVANLQSVSGNTARYIVSGAICKNTK